MSNTTYKLIILCSALLIGSFLLPIFSRAGLDPITADGWRVDAKPSVVECNFTNKSVAKFLDQYRGVDIDDPELAEPAAKPEQVGDFKWIDINKDGIYELFVTFAETRAFFHGPIIFQSQNGKKVRLQTITGWPAKSKIADSMIDLNNDGTPELLISRYLTYYRGAVTSDIWTAIYQWDGQKYSDQSGSFKNYYKETLLPKVKARIEELSAQAPNPATSTPDEIAYHELRIAMQQALRDKILRFTGLDSRAGIDLSRTWARSNDPELNTLAIGVFKDAGIDTYRADIQFLANNPNPTVANYAKAALNSGS